jgi:hypothetical protein
MSGQTKPDILLLLMVWHHGTKELSDNFYYCHNKVMDVKVLIK